MMNPDILDELLFDEAAWQIASQRLPILQRVTLGWADDNTLWETLFTIQPTEAHRTLVHRVAEYLRLRTSAHWVKRLADLASALDVVDEFVYTPMIARCRGRGWFDQPNPHSHREQPLRPHLSDIVPRVRGVLRQHGTVEERASAFVTQGICRDRTIAVNVATTLIDLKVATQAASVTSSLLQAWVDHGAIGVLHASSYPYRDELGLIERFVQTMSAGSLEPHHLFVVRRDVIALRRSIPLVDPTLWNPILLQSSHDNPQRQRLVKRFRAEQKQRIIEALYQHHLHADDAPEQLLDQYLASGIASIVAWRTSTDDIQARRALEQRQIAHALDYSCQGLDRRIRNLITQRLDQLRLAADTAEITLPYYLLIATPPTSKRRRIWRQRYLATNRPHRSPSAKWSAQAWQRHIPETYKPSQLIDAFAEHALVAKNEAKLLLHQLITYGGIGLIPQTMWKSMISEQLYEWLRLIRLGHRSGSLAWENIVEQAYDLCHRWNIPCPSAHVLQAIFQTIKKPRFWHGGKGLVLINVHQRVPTVVTKRPQLNATWVVVSIPVPWALKAGRATNYLVLVADWETQLPIGCWVSVAKPTEQDIALALYQALWHYGSTTWPIRGIPSRIVLAQSLHLSNINELQRACWHLMTTVTIEDVSLRDKPRLQRLVEALKHDTTTLLDDPSGRIRDTTQALVRVMGWMQRTIFPYHRQQELPPDLRVRGVALPGSTTEAAGWLLPRMGTAVVQNQSITVEDRVYRLLSTIIADGTSVTYRRCPIFIPAIEVASEPLPDGVFIEDNNATTLVFALEQ